MLPCSGAVLFQIKLCLARLCELIGTAQVINPPHYDFSVGRVLNDEHERWIIIPSLPL